MEINSYYGLDRYLKVNDQAKRKLVLILIDDNENFSGFEYFRLIKGFFTSEILAEFDIRVGKLHHAIRLRPEIIIFNWDNNFSERDLYDSIEFIKNNGIKIVCELGGDLQYAQDRLNKSILIKESACVIVSTSSAIEVCNKFNEKIVLIENSIRGSEVGERYGRFDLPLKILFIGDKGDIEVMKPILEALKRLNSEGFMIKLYLVGIEYFERDNGYIVNIPIPEFCKGYLSFLRWIKIFSYMDFGIVPNSTNYTNSLKSVNRYFDYLSIGLPIISSSASEFSSLIIDGENGFLASDNEWYSKIKYIYENKANDSSESAEKVKVSVNCNLHSTSPINTTRINVLRKLIN